MTEIKANQYKYKNEAIELIINNNGIYHISEEAIKFLYSFRNQKIVILSINGYNESDKINLVNNFIPKESEFKTKNCIKGIWLWGNPINIDKDVKMIILDCEEIKDNKLNNINLLNILISSFYLFFKNGQIEEEFIQNFINIYNISNYIEMKTNHKLANFILINDLLNESELKNKIENNPKFLNSNLMNLSKERKYKKISNIKEILKNNELTIDKYYEGRILFGLIQNFVYYMNNSEKINIDIAYEDIFLYKANKIYGNYFENNKMQLYSKTEYPTSVYNIYKNYSEIQNSFISSFCNKINDIITPSNSGIYINEFCKNMEKEINYIINKNDNYYNNYLYKQYNEFEASLKNDDLDDFSNFHKFIAEYFGKFDLCLQKFLNIFSNSDTYERTLSLLLTKIYNEYIVNKFINISKKINNSFNDKINSYIEEINTLKANIDKLDEELKLKKSIIESKNQEKIQINKNYFELENKFDKFNREYQMQLKESQNLKDIDAQKYKNMETYYLGQLKEKENAILDLERKIEKLNQDMRNQNKDSTIKINELNRENSRLINEIEILKNRNSSNFMGSDKNLNFGTLLKNLNQNFIDFKESVENLNKENNNIQKNKYIENATQEIDTKLKNAVNDIKNFCDKQLKAVSDKYDNLIKNIKNENEELKFELSKKKFSLSEIMLLKETYEKKYNESNLSMNSLKSIIQDKENLIKTKDELHSEQDKIINDNEIKLAQAIIDFKMKEDENERIYMTISSMVEKKKKQFEKGVDSMPKQFQIVFQNLVNKYKIFK